MNILFLVLGGCVLLAIPFVFLPLLHRLSEGRHRYAQCVAMFYDLAPGLAANETLSDGQVAMLRLISDNIDRPQIIFQIISAMIGTRSKATAKTAAQLTFDREVEELPEDLRNKFQTALTSGLLGLSYSAPLRGWLLRTIWLNPVGMPQRTIDAPHFAFRAFAPC